ncbi:uncharacterized protein Z518_06770 [Rhinocladiella mackenziei CBS 650.93]|uniref:DNA-directed RNA polymerase III subunit RPC9 n=1 Tax=Rhinocladiella mackenziei CBS 650.93 TaxID=1442369 RepID=A0A0D2GYC2_9EURO|nr:uncharacterized protein Z518_06770 [Rhinocladiella mackenziei CBS 650.93]KIX03218.1 hypothetical protein Z518_06770 [Rhinocladiella mackenziei CBS 650.93]
MRNGLSPSGTILLILWIRQVVDPQAALLATSEVHRFLASNPPRPPFKKIGSHQSVNLKNYQRVRQDFQHYVTTTIPYIEAFSPPETFIKSVVPKLRAFGLTKTEALMLINLGVGLPRNQYSQAAAAETETGATNGDVEEGNEEAAAQEVQEPDDRQLLSLVIEELEERFPGEQGEAKMEKILQTMKAEFDRAHAATNGHGTKGS